MVNRLRLGGLAALFLVLVIAVTWIYSAYQDKQSDLVPGKEGSGQEVALAGEGMNVNENGDFWTVPDGPVEYAVSSGGDEPVRFWRAKIDPVKVYPGDTQNMYILVSGLGGIVSVRAEIETDNGSHVVELEKKGVVAASDQPAPQYVVDENRQLKILDADQGLAERRLESRMSPTASFVSTARAEEPDREAWEGSWVVYDTSVRNYNTTFIATDSQGNEKKLVMAWSDPCQTANFAWWPESGDVTAGHNCSLNQVYGVDAGNLTIPLNVTITINSGGALAFNPGKSVTISGGQIAVAGGGEVRKAYLYAMDADADGYAADSSRVISASPTNSGQSGYNRRQANLYPTSAVDCYDGNPAAFPKDYNSEDNYYYYYDRGDGSHDYDCYEDPYYVDGAWYATGGDEPSNPVYPSEAESIGDCVMNIYQQICKYPEPISVNDVGCGRSLSNSIPEWEEVIRCDQLASYCQAAGVQTWPVYQLFSVCR